ncbi:MAG: hypothetical protein H0V71_07220 [Chloroflexi bacterium]|nr:hypothetical protein [Chloroflexota bacterium]
MVSLAGSEVRVVYDLYDHVPHELMAAARGRPVEARDDLQLIRQRLVLETVLRTGDASSARANASATSRWELWGRSAV